MSTTVSIGIDGERLDTVVEELTSRFIQPILVARAGESYADAKEAPIPALVEQGAFVAYVGFQLPNGHTLPLDVLWRGRSASKGAEARRDGELRLRCSLSDLRVGTTTENAEQLFFCACGAAEASRPRHAAMYWETGWPSGPLCPMVFHRDPLEFAWDLERARAETAGERTYCESLWGLSGQGGFVPPPTAFLRQFDDHAALASFLRHLTPDVVERATRLRASDVVDTLRMVCQDSAGELSVRSFDDGSVAVWARPIDKTACTGGRLRFRSIWKVYEALVQLA